MKTLNRPAEFSRLTGRTKKKCQTAGAQSPTTTKAQRTASQNRMAAAIELLQVEIEVPGTKTAQRLPLVVRKSILLFARVVLALLCGVGAMDIYDTLHPEISPYVGCVGVQAVRHAVRHPGNEPVSPGEAEASGLKYVQPGLIILDDVCPEVSAWVRRLHSGGRILFRGRHDDGFARYDLVSGTLILCPRFFDSAADVKAEVLAHEYRHSLQNLTRLIRSAVHDCLGDETSEDVIENAAYRFEYEIHDGIEVTFRAHGSFHRDASETDSGS